MTTQYTPILQLALPVTGELNGTWGDVVNDNITSMVEEAIAGLATISTWTTNAHALTTADGVTDEARCAMLVLQTGAGGTALSGAGQVICPARTKLYVVKNDAAYAVTIKTSGGSGVAIAAGDTAFVFCDGTNVNACVTQIINGHITGNLTVDGNTTLGDASGDTVTVNAGTTTFVNANPTLSQGTATRILFLNGSKVIADAAGLTWDGTTMSATRVATSQVNITGQGDLRLEDTTGGEYVALQAPGTLAASYTLTMPVDDGTNGQALITDGNGNLSWSTAASGDVYGPASATDNAVTRFDGTTGKLIQNSGVIIDDSNNVTGVVNLTSSGSVTLSGGTANGVAYLNGSKVLTTGSALTFDGSNLVATASSTAYSKVRSSGSGTVAASLYQNGDTGTTDSDGLFVGVTGNTPYIYNYENSPLVFGINAAEQMRLTSTGLGIGTSSPGYKLTVSGVAPILAEFNSASSEGVAIRLSSNGTATGYIASQKFIYGTGNTTDLTVYTAGTLTFGTNGAERMRIDSSGNVGIGTSAPVSLLNVLQSGDTATSGFVLQRTGANRGSIWLNATDDTFNITRGGTAAIAISTSGNVGIGVTPSAWGLGKAIEINSKGNAVWSSSATAIQITANAYYDSAFKYGSSAAAGRYLIAENSHIWSIAPSGTAGSAISFTQAMTLDASGNLLVGATSGNQRLVLKGGDTNTSIYLENGSTSVGYFGVAKGYNSSFSATDILVGGYANNTIFANNNTERMRIDSSGNVGIGTSSPSGKLSVAGTTTGAAQVAATFANEGLTSGSTVRINFLSGEDGTVGRTRAIIEALAPAANDGALSFQTRSAGAVAEKMRLDASGNLGLGVTPSAWITYKALQVQNAALYSYSNNAYLSANAYQGASNPVYISTGYATQLTQANGQFQFLTAPSGTAGNAISFTQAMTLDASGRLLIGSTTSQGKLNVVQSLSGTYGNAGVWISDNATTSLMLNNISSGVSGVWTSGALVFGSGNNNSTERMRIDTSGNVGIGTSSPRSTLNVVGDITLGATPGATVAGTAYSIIGNTASSGNAAGGDLTIAAGGGSGATANGNLYLRAGQTASPLSITTGGNVFIETGKPSNGQATGYIAFNRYAGSPSTAVESMRLDASGNLGLGITPSAWTSTHKAIQLQGGGSVYNNGADAYINVASNSYYTGTAWKRVKAGLATQYIQASGLHYWSYAPTGVADSDIVSWTTAMTLNASGNLAVVSSTPTPFNLTGAGGGCQINFNDGTQNANWGLGVGGAGITGIASPSTYPFVVYTNSTERMRIDSSGNLGLGVTPSAWSVNTSRALQLPYGYAALSANYGLGIGTLSSNAYENGNGTWKYVNTQYALNYQQNAVAGNHAWFTAPSGTAGNAISFTQAMTLDASGNLLVGTTSVGGVGLTNVIQSSNGILSIWNTDYASGFIAQQFRYNGTAVGSVVINTTSTSFNTSSDYRLKENIQPMQNALGVVAQLNPVTYTWKADGSDGQGFIAHELQAVVPDCVTGEKDAVDKDGKPVYQGIDTSFLVATLTKAIQEQQELINQLTARVAQLEGN